MTLVDELVNARASIDAEIAGALVHLRATCKHAELVECDYVPMMFGNALPPLRLCVTCGAEEPGWYCGYQALTGAASPVERDALYRLRKPGDRYLVGQGAWE